MKTKKSGQMMTKEEVFSKKAADYLVCFAESCPRHEQCLRWLVGQYTPTDWACVQCVNPRNRLVGEGRCGQFRSDQPVQMARGMTHIFTDDMPLRVIHYVRSALIADSCRTLFYEYWNGTRLIPPAMQQRVRQLFRKAGWQQPVDFDAMVVGFEW